MLDNIRTTDCQPMLERRVTCATDFSPQRSIANNRIAGWDILGSPGMQQPINAPTESDFQNPYRRSSSNSEARDAPTRQPISAHSMHQPRRSRWDATSPHTPSIAQAGPTKPPGIRAAYYTSLTPDLDKQISESRSQRLQAVREHYLTSKTSSGSGMISPHFALQSALMELSDTALESDAMRARTEFLEQSLVRTQEDAFAYSAITSAAQHA